MCTSMVLKYIPRLLQFSKIVQGVRMNLLVRRTYPHLMSAPGRKIVSYTDLVLQIIAGVE